MDLRRTLELRGWTLLKYLVIIVVAYFVLERLFLTEFEPEPDTLRYLYSALFQGFATLAAIMVAILGLNYQRLKDSKDAFFGKAKALAINLHGSVSDDYEIMRDYMLNWIENASKRKTDELRDLAGKFRLASINPGGPPTADQQVHNLKVHFGEVRGEMERYEEIVRNLGQYKKSAHAFERTLLLESVMATVPAFLIVLAAPVALGTIDQLDSSASREVAFGLLYFTVIAAALAFSFFATMLGILFGGFRTSGYNETKLPRPEAARKVLAEVREMMGWH